MASGSGTRIWPGRPAPLGATWDGEGVNFAVSAAHATGVELCLFERRDSPFESERIALSERAGDVWHGYLPDARPGCLYGFRVDGPWAPAHGLRFNRHKLLVDPYAKALARELVWDDSLYGYTVGAQAADLSFDERDSAPFMPRSLVVETAFSWGDDAPPRVPWHRTVIYEAHVRGLSRLHPDVPEAMRGTYLGMASEPIVEHLRALGVTALELLPVQAFVSERRLVQMGLVNSWGYNTLGFFAPDARYASGDLGQQVGEFKTMVKKLHKAGIEVILDVVYNHTAEGDHLGPNLCMRGFDNSAYYHLNPEDKRYYMNYTGCGNSLDTSTPVGMRLVMDSLRYWVSEMHVDGFRFDLAPVLGRRSDPAEPYGMFFDVVRQEPLLADVKLIAEPWDLGGDVNRLRRFPPGWAEWNGAYRDCVRRFWRGDPHELAELASRLSGSSDLYSGGPNGSINFVTCHDGYTLHDLVSYEQKHNLANGERNEDGHNDNCSRNWGHEGETDDEGINALRERMKRNLIATLALSQGVPMFSAGDELGRTQRGNNNAYCQDNELSWVNWELTPRQASLLAYCRRLSEVHIRNPALHRRAFFHGHLGDGSGLRDVRWIRPDGADMTEADWRRGGHVLGMLMHGEAADEQDERGRPLRGDSLLLLLNGGGDSVGFRLPELQGTSEWTELISSVAPERADPEGRAVRVQTEVALPGHSLLLLAHETPA